MNFKYRIIVLIKIEKKRGNTVKEFEYIPKIIRASLDHDDRALRLLSVNLMRRLKSTNPEVASQIGKALDLNAIGASSRRGLGVVDSPIDKENKFDLLDIEEPFNINRPVFEKNINLFIDNFLKEREKTNKLLDEGLFPTASIILYGPPGVGKTYLARYLAGELNIKFATLNLAAAVSSYLGKTGQNLKSVLDFAKKEPTVLLLDEFDSIAKKRDDNSELGELKRIVNVLLKELEDWPYHSIVIAATNYPELLDKAIWRRFDVSIEIKLPNSEQRLEIIKRALGNKYSEINDDILNTLCEITEKMSPDDICKIIERARKNNILNEENIIQSIFKSFINLNIDTSVNINKKICSSLKNNTKLSISKIADLIGKSKSTVQYYLK